MVFNAETCAAWRQTGRTVRCARIDTTGESTLAAQAYASWGNNYRNHVENSDLRWYL